MFLKDLHKAYDLFKQAIDKDDNLFFLIDYETSGYLYNNLGYNYYNGDGIEKDDEKAFQCLKKSANVYGNEYGMVHLAQMYLDANHILPDTVDYNLAAYSMANDYLYPNHKTAFELLEKAADKGYMYAINLLGYYYRNGKYCMQNYKKAFECFEKSAKNNNAYGMYQLGLMYDFGEYKEKNSSIANDLYMKAVEKVEKGDHNLSDVDLGILYNNLGNNYRQGDGIGQYYSRALELLTKAVQYDKKYAARNLGHMYYYGQGIDIDYDKAMELYEQAANAGNVKAMNDLGFYLKKGQHIEKDLKKAFEWFSKSAKLNSSYAMFQLGIMYGSGQYVEKDYQQSNNYYQKAIDNLSQNNDMGGKNNTGILYKNLALHHYEGKGTTQNYQKAYELFLKAESYGNSVAMYHLGLMYTIECHKI
ncbi:MAG: sel1 repeat family protein [Erysipelotrichaceae bacterium]|nr:sel1 repeat family protein [Erysipelotrichaceae bacterium]